MDQNQAAQAACEFLEFRPGTLTCLGSEGSLPTGGFSASAMTANSISSLTDRGIDRFPVLFGPPTEYGSHERAGRGRGQGFLARRGYPDMKDTIGDDENKSPLFRSSG